MYKVDVVSCSETHRFVFSLSLIVFVCHLYLETNTLLLYLFIGYYVSHGAILLYDKVFVRVNH